MFGNALGNSIAGEIRRGQEQRKLESVFDKAGIAYDRDANGNVIARSGAMQSAASALLANGASQRDMLAILGDAGLQSAFTGLDQANASLLNKAAGLEDELAGLAGLGSSSESLSQQSSGSHVSGHLTIEITQRLESTVLLQAGLSAVAPVATALAELADQSYGAAVLLAATGQAVLGGGGVGQVVKRVGQIAAGNAFEQAQDTAAGLVTDHVHEYLTRHSGLDADTVGLLSSTAGFATSFVLGIGAGKVIGDAGKVREMAAKRYDGQKPLYHENPAHKPGYRGFNPSKTPLPRDAKEVFSGAVPNDPNRPTAWFGKNKDGQIYRYSVGNDGTAHFSGIDGVGDGVRNISKYARDRLRGID